MSELGEAPAAAAANQAVPALRENIRRRVEHTPANIAIPLFSNPQIRIDLDRKDCDFIIQEVLFDMATMDAVSLATYQQLQAVLIADIVNVMPQANFQRFWKTIVLKRLLDIFEGEKGRRHAQFGNIRIAPTTLTPRPLADILFAVGMHRCFTTGIEYHVVPPAHPAVNPPDWWQLDNAVTAEWHRLMAIIRDKYQIIEMPRRTDFIGLPLVHTVRNDIVNDVRQTKGYLNCFNMTEAFLTLVNGNMLSQVNPQNAHILATEQMDTVGLMTNYVGSYTIQSNT
jgi:hypothetical protein